MAYSGVYVFGDSLVDSGNALKLAQTYNYFPFTSLPDGAPTTSKGYYSGNFTNGWTLADLISNKYVADPTKTVFPFGYDEPFLGISFGFVSDPNGDNLNFAYGGAQIRQGDEAVPDLDDQTDAFRDAMDGEADPNALHIFSFGANDVHDLVPNETQWADRSTARAHLADCADEYVEEVRQLIEIGAEHILIIGVPDIGIQPIFNGTPDEATRRAIATEYSELLDQMIRTRLDALDRPDGVEIHYVSWDAMQDQVIGTMADLHGDAAVYPLEDSSAVFFDQVHPTAQVHALGAAYILDQLNGAPSGEQAALSAWNYRLQGSINTRSEVDTVTIAIAANSNYSFQMLGISTLGGNSLTLADPKLTIFGPSGTLLASNDDGGLGLDASLAFTSGTAGEYRIQLNGVGAMTGNYIFQALGSASGNNSYNVSTGKTIVLEGVGGGTDTVKASVSYTLNAGAEVELLQTSNALGTTSINLTGNEFGQRIVGNAGINIIEGKGGADVMTGGAGKDVFVLSMTAVSNPGAVNIDRITDYGTGDVVDLSQVLKVAAGTNVVSGGFVRVTTTGLIQVDVTGGGNSWVTLSEINSGGAVAIRYLSGGTATNLSLSRVPAGSTTALATAVAAAGLTANAVTAPVEATDLGGSSAVVTAAKFHLAQIDSFSQVTPMRLSLEPREPADAAAAQESRAGTGELAAGHSLTGTEPISSAASTARSSAAEPADGVSASWHAIAAPSVVMPGAEMLLPIAGKADHAAPEVAKLVAEALVEVPPTIDALLAVLPGSGAGPDVTADVSQAATSWMVADAALLATDLVSFHPDLAPVA